MMLSSISSSHLNMSVQQVRIHSDVSKNTEAETRDVEKTKDVDNTSASNDDEGSEQQGLQKFNDQELRELESLKARDREVKAHERAHLSAAGGFATGGASFSFKQGPDGVRYAVAGEVQIDTSPVPGDAAATIRKADVIRRAAMAPAQPSGPDLQIAARATAMASDAQVEQLLETSKMQETEAADEDQGQQTPTIKIDISV
jgi:hypothetical protein